MSVQVSLDLPEGVFSALRTDPEDFGRQMRLAAAVKWYEMGMVSQGKASEIAGLPRVEFLEACSHFKVSPFQTTSEELAEEVQRG